MNLVNFEESVYYTKQDGLDCIWLVDNKGSYNCTSDHKWLYEKFQVIEYSDESDFFGEDRPAMGPLTPKVFPHDTGQDTIASS